MHMYLQSIQPLRLIRFVASDQARLSVRKQKKER